MAEHIAEVRPNGKNKTGTICYEEAPDDQSPRGAQGYEVCKLSGKLCRYLHIERDSKKIVKRLAAEGWELISVRGSHHKFSRDGATIIVPHPRRDLPIGTARAIAKAAGWL